MAAATATAVEIPRETIEEALVALGAAESFFETMAGNVHPAPWELFGETITKLYHAAFGSFDGDPAVGEDSDDFCAHYNKLEARAREEARKGWETTWADAYSWIPEEACLGQVFSVPHGP